MKLYTYWRSTAAYRVRIALNYKNISYNLIPIDIAKNEQLEANYRRHNPQGRIPTLIDGDFELGQSMAILEYLEEQYPASPLLPHDSKARAWIRYFCQIIVSDMHPLNNSGSLRFLENELGHRKQEILQWYHHWLKKGFDALETLLNHFEPEKNGSYCWGHVFTLADICLIPQVYNAQRFEFSMAHYPRIMHIYNHCLSLPYVMKASPEHQPDFPKNHA